MFGILLSTDMAGASVTNCTLPDYSCRRRSGSTYQATCFMLQTLEKINIRSSSYFTRKAWTFCTLQEQMTEILLLCTDVASHKLSVESARFQGLTVMLMEILTWYEELAGKMLPPIQRSIVPPYAG